MDFSIECEGYNSVDAMSPCFAWMIPPVPDEDVKPSVQWSTDTTQFKFNDKTLSITYGMLVPSDRTDGIALVRQINGAYYAIIKRGLLQLGDS